MELGHARSGSKPHPPSPHAEAELVASSRPVNRFIIVPGSRRADQMEAMLRQADASLEKWFGGAKKRGAGILRHRVDDLQAGLKKLSAGLEHLEQRRTVAPSQPPDHKPQVMPSKRRARLATARKTSVPRKRKKAA